MTFCRKNPIFSISFGTGFLVAFPESVRVFGVDALGKVKTMEKRKGLGIMKSTAKRLTSLIAVSVSMIVCTVGCCSPPPSQTNDPVIVTGGSAKVIIPPSEQYPTDRAFIEAIQKLIPANGEPLTWRLEPENISVTEKQWQAYLADNLRKAKEAADYRKKAGIKAPKKIHPPNRANDKASSDASPPCFAGDPATVI